MVIVCSMLSPCLPLNNQKRLSKSNRQMIPKALANISLLYLTQRKAPMSQIDNLSSDRKGSASMISRSHIYTLACFILSQIFLDLHVSISPTLSMCVPHRTILFELLRPRFVCGIPHHSAALRKRSYSSPPLALLI